MKFRAALFDLDGTLLDTLEDIADSMNRVLAAHGLPTHPLDSYRYHVGDGVRLLVARVLPESRRDDTAAASVLAAYRADYARHWKDKTRPYPGVDDMLHGLARRGLRLAVLSNKPHESTVQCVAELLPGHAFDAVHGQQEHVPQKPNPAGALKIARQLGIAPADFLYLGDTSVDMRTAVAAGMFPVGALWGFRTEQELRASGALALAARPQDLLSLADAADGPATAPDH